MTTLADMPASHRAPPALFAVTVFSSAALVFVVQPMVAKLVLPLLGGSSSVWNTSMAFFQLALLAGYFYAHLLQRIPTVRGQALTHVAAVVIAAVALPLRVNGLAGPPSSEHPNLWLLAVLTLSIGAPFAVLSATAPLVQAWHARTIGAAEGKEPYVLYAASNLGSLLALLAYPIAVEPAFTLLGQRLGWSLGYGVFVLIIGVLAIAVSRVRAQAVEGQAAAATPKPSWRQRIIWVLLAAIPSSLMLGVTTYITTDVASAPFLWVLPLALYLTTFIVAFQDRPAISPTLTLTLQGAALAACVALLPFRATFFGLVLFVHLAAFFLTALMCHQRLVAQRPDPTHLTEFYLCLSLGGVVGGGFNAFVAPVIFNDVWEYPLILALSCLARPWGVLTKVPIATWVMFVVGVVAAVLTPIVVTFAGARVTTESVVGAFDQSELFDMGMKTLLILAVICAFMIRRYALFFFAIIAVLSYASEVTADRTDTRESWRSFFGVLKRSETYVPNIGGEVKMLAHGTTLHGAQAQADAYRCKPMVYYTPSTPIGQVFTTRIAAAPSLRIGAVGLGTGSVAAYTRPGDHLTFFEIDPLVVKVATDPKNFTYTTECARGRLDYVIGDARLTVADQPDASFDILLIDAFSSDAVPAHLLTVEAVRGYLAKLKPDGILILHLSNRNLDLLGPAQAVARAAGGHGLIQTYRPDKEPEGSWESAEDAVIVARNPEALEAYARSGKWKAVNPFLARPWTDDYTNLAGSLYANLKGRWSWLP
ncbi:fused MFS/spermidine synthase [Phenylobacterium kunshanense]|uniref:Spermidine synthase n=1 Tax=Phenylobacterium kunshanense TaxID=1445034 RepID=A0A328BQW5_9CAUL|nr:fused MFS/spermidine synthase [Phenylobacterium kunshanense]RAK68911.1 spermidine synthase [Phenylobacterium kunshanense]